MKTRTAALLAGLALFAAPLEAQPACPTSWTIGPTNFTPCRLGHFTFTDWLFDNSYVPGNLPPFSTIMFQLFDGRLDMTVVGTGPFAFDADPARGTTFFEERFALGILSDDPNTMFYATSAQTAAMGTFNVPAGGDGSLEIGVKFGDGDQPWTGYQSGDGCQVPGGATPRVCQLASIGLGSGTPMFGSTVFSTGWRAAINGNAGSASFGDQTWTASLYFVMPGSITPEPSTWVLMATGLTLVGIIAWRRRAG